MLGIPTIMGGFRALLIPPIINWWNSVVYKFYIKSAFIISRFYLNLFMSYIIKVFK